MRLGVGRVDILIIYHNKDTWQAGGPCGSIYIVVTILHLPNPTPIAHVKVNIHTYKKDGLINIPFKFQRI